MILRSKPIHSPDSIAEELWLEVTQVKNIIARVKKRIKIMELEKETFI
jgi:hypothetical protein